MSAKKKSKVKKWIVFGIVILAAAALVIGAILRPRPSVYESVTAETGDITTYYSFSGNVETKNRQTVLAEKVMQLDELKVKEGDTVKEGAVLFTTTTGDEVTAKIDGEITNLKAEESGSYMAGVTLMEIVDYNHLEISVKADEYDVSALEAGKQATAYIGALDKELTGTISSISKEGQVVNGVTYFTAALDLPQDDRLRVGMSAEVKLVSGSVTGAVTLPMAAIQFDDSNRPYVFKADEKGNPVKSDITVGINDGTTAEIQSGVADGDTILYKKASSVPGYGPMGGAE